MMHKNMAKKSILNLLVSITSLLIGTASIAAAAPSVPSGASAPHPIIGAQTSANATAANGNADAVNATGAGVVAATTPISSVTPYYVGGTLGWGDTYQTVFSGAGAHNGNSSGLGGRIYVGYRFTDTMAVEGGYSRIANVSGSYNTIDPVFGPINASGTISTYIFDAVLKLNHELENRFSLFSIYAKLGIAYLNEDGGNLNSDALILYQIPGSPVEAVNQGNPVGNKLLPTFSFGVNYHLAKNIDADLAWMHVEMVGSSALKSVDMVGLGLAYNFNI
jgi:hypothetical protein